MSHVVAPARRSAGLVAPPTRARAGSGQRAGRVVLGVIGVIVTLAWVFPVYWMVSSSLLPNVRLQSTRPSFFPTGASLDNYAAVLNSGTFFPALRMSVAVTLATIVLTIAFAFLAALAISRYRFKGRRTFILAVLFIQMLP